jgi:hypothetical protein
MFDEIIMGNYQNLGSVSLAIPTVKEYDGSSDEGVTPSFVRELCVVLEHRWRPQELFVLFTAYLDESDTHGTAPTVIMAGFLGHARQ